ncbi:MAG: NosD domain-containing protein, partial [Candidatus Micrarchaeia archaeon]
IENNTIGLNATSASGNLIYDNLFNNTINAYATGTNNWNTTKTRGFNRAGGLWYGGNLWRDYAGADSDEDGIGDTPHTVSASIADYLPMMRVNIIFVEECGNLSASGRYALIKNLPRSTVTCLTMTSDGVNLDCMGFGIIGMGTAGSYGINITNRNHIKIRNCIITDFDRNVHFYGGATNRTVADSNVSNATTAGVYLEGSAQNVLLSRLDIKNNTYGIAIVDSNYNNVTYCNITNSTTGIKSWGVSEYNNILYNNISNNSGGINFEVGSQYNLVRNNIIYNNYLDGINITACGSGFVTDNWFINNTIERNIGSGLRVTCSWCIHSSGY